MLEKAAVAAMREAPVYAPLAEEAFASMVASIKATMGSGAKEMVSANVAGRAVTHESANIINFAGHSALKETPGKLQLLSADGARLHMTKDNIAMYLPNGTEIVQSGNVMSTRLPTGEVVRQTKLASDHVVTTIDGKVLPSRHYGEQEIAKDVWLSNGAKHASSLSLKDGTYVGHDTYGFSVFRGAKGNGWAGGQADLTITRRYTANEPSLTLHNPREENMFASNFLEARPSSGAYLRTNNNDWAKFNFLLRGK